MSVINKLILRSLNKFPAELSHNITIKLLKYGIIPNYKINSNINTKLNNINFSHPIGIAAGFDKNAETFFNIHKIGVSHIEVGTITPEIQYGNPKPRIFRLNKDNAIINSLGFPSKGMEYVLKQLKNKKCNIPLGINIGANKNTSDHIKDYTILTRRLGKYADWITINISSPNTPGLRNLQTSSRLIKLLSSVNDERKNIEDNAAKKLQVWLKIAPDLNDDQLKIIIDSAIKFNIDALSISNTTISRPNNLKSQNKFSNGGLSGKPIFNLSTKMLAKAYLHANREIKLIGIGGVDNPKSAFTKILAGANLVQTYTGLVYNGPLLINDILDYLSFKITDSKIEEFVGTKAKEIAFGDYLNDFK